VHSSDESVETKLCRIADKARKDLTCQFTSLFHLMTEEMLRGCFMRLKDNAAAGIDQVTKVEYGLNLDENLTELVNRLHRMVFIPQPVRRVYIPKAGSKKKRPIGIPTLEDKLVQSGLVRIVQAIYEQDFIGDSYGFRPRRGCHDALRALSRTVESGTVNHIVEADIRGFFDNVDQDQLMRFLGHRIADKRVLRYIKRFLQAGISEEGAYRASERGTPQGGSISPLLSNIYLHYTLDLWFERRFRRSCAGGARLIRYADDFVVCFQQESDAKRFRMEMEQRLNQFALELAPEKTKVLEFGPYAAQCAKGRGTKAETVDFLGFTHYCSRTRDGRRFRMKRKTASKRFSGKVGAVKEWLKSNRTLPTAMLLQRLSAKLMGHYAYYGVTDNSKSIGRFYYEVLRLLFKWLNRRGKRWCCSWEKLELLMQRFPLPAPCIKVCLS
jgi:RNA-directed DNA polymerase